MPPPLSQHDGPAGIAAAAATHNTTRVLQIGKLWPATVINACRFLVFPPSVITVDSVDAVHLGVHLQIIQMQSCDTYLAETRQIGPLKFCSC